jgi:fructose-1,6-bisphosphatase/sedoheptulose 1,7-bisphosphatase-like protein
MRTCLVLIRIHKIRLLGRLAAILDSSFSCTSNSAHDRQEAILVRTAAAAPQAAIPAIAAAAVKAVQAHLNAQLCAFTVAVQHFSTALAAASAISLQCHSNDCAKLADNRLQVLLKHVRVNVANLNSRHSTRSSCIEQFRTVRSSAYIQS